MTERDLLNKLNIDVCDIHNCNKIGHHQWFSDTKTFEMKVYFLCQEHNRKKKCKVKAQAMGRPSWQIVYN